MWAGIMKDLGAKSPEAMMLRFHTQTGGSTLTAQQPENNITRVTIQALAAVLGGTQSLHTNGFDEALSLPTENAARIALRTQQIIAYESGVTETVDPIGGSYFVEAMTDALELEAQHIINTIDAMGGSVAAIENGWMQAEIASSSYQYQKDIEKKSKIIVGVNDFITDSPRPGDLLKVDETIRQKQTDRIQSVKIQRNQNLVTEKLNALQIAAKGEDNVMPYIIDAVESYATLGEICDTLRDVFGEYKG
jgi:methylmalonyl-CoA mutase N-terminal domain/subunit